MSTGTQSPFAMKANNKEGGDYELCPSGVHSATLVALIDLGTTTAEYKQKTYDRHKICLVWELMHETDKKGENFLILQDYTSTLKKDTDLRNVVDGFKGKSLSDEEDFDPFDMLGKPCTLSVIWGTSKAGKDFSEVASVSPIQKGVTLANPTRDLVAFHLSHLRHQGEPIPVPDWVPPLYGRNVIEEIKKSKEWRSLPLSDKDIPF